VSAPANLQPYHDIQGMTVNWVGEEPRLACCVCDNYQQAINTRAAPRFLLQPMLYSPVCGHMGSQCFDEGDRGNWADRWFHGTRVGTRVGHTGPGYPSTRVLTSLFHGCESSMVRKFFEHSRLRSESSRGAKVSWIESSWTFRSQERMFME